MLIFILSLINIYLFEEKYHCKRKITISTMYYIVLDIHFCRNVIFIFIAGI